jgi:hypothetical protein
VAHQEEVTTVAEGEDGRLHVGGAELDTVEGGQLEVVTEERGRHIGQEIGMFWEFFIGEETLNIFLWSTGAHKVTIDGVELVLSSDDEQISPNQGHLRLADIHVLDVYWRTVCLFLEDGLFSALLGFVAVIVEVVTDHADR